MTDLIGNGQPGRMALAENEIKNHSRLIWIGVGGLGVLQFVTLIIVAFVKK